MEQSKGFAQIQPEPLHRTQKLFSKSPQSDEQFECALGYFETFFCIATTKTNLQAESKLKETYEMLKIYESAHIKDSSAKSKILCAKLKFPQFAMRRLIIIISRSGGSSKRSVQTI